jgi:signal transduction histidine kinase
LRDGAVSTFTKTNGLPSDQVSSLYFDSEGVLWAGTTSGLARYQAGKWRVYAKKDGLISNSTGYIVDDEHGYLWIGSNAGLMRLKKKALEEFNEKEPSESSIACRTYGEPDGLPANDCTFGSQPGAIRTKSGKLLFPTTKGLAALNPTQLTPNTNPPPVIIETVRVDGQLQSTNGLRGTRLEKLTIPAGKESLDIRYTSLNLSAPDKGRFKYRLEGHEKAWRQAAWNLRVAHYTKVPHGHYRFQVIAGNEDDVWNEVGASLAIVVLPPFWQTWWFLTAATLTLLGMVVGSVHWVSTQKLQRQLEGLRQQEALEHERARIARDLHDQLGANLTQVALLGELAEADKDNPQEVEVHAKQISHTARDTTRALDEIVWTVNPLNDTLDGLMNYVCKYAQEYLAIAGLRYRLDVPAQLPAIPISPELRHNVFLATKEAVNNVVKHAQASSVWLRLRLEPSRFVLEVEDNGKGLPETDVKSTRSGMRNMRKRLEDVRGEFSVSKGAEGGTIVRLSVPLDKAG